VMQTNTTASTSLIIRGTRPLVGSDYKVCVLASDSSNLTTPTRCYSIQLPRPRPMIMAPPNKEAYTTAVGCPLVIPMLAQDRTNFDLDPAISLANGYGVLIQALYTLTRSRYHETKTVGLPIGARLSSVDLGVAGINSSDPISYVSAGTLQTPQEVLLAKKNPATADMEWVARKGQEGFTYTICFVALGSEKAFNSIEGDGDGSGQDFCLHVDVQRCRYCAQREDTIHSVAKAWHGAWLDVWSGNHMHAIPDAINVSAANAEESALSVGVVYSVDTHDDLWHVAQRFGLDLSDLLFWNPDLSDGKAKEQHYRLALEQQLCLLPATCVYAARVTHQSWDTMSTATHAIIETA